VLVRGAGGWAEQAKLLASDGAPADIYGSAVAVDADTALIGAQLDDHSGLLDAGSAYVVDLVGDSDGDGIPDNAVLLWSPTGNTTVGGVSVNDEDVVRFVEQTGSYELYFDGSQVGLGGFGEDVDAVHVRPDGSLLLSFATTISVPGLGSVPDEDVVRFVPSSLGATTAGSYELFFDGSAHGLTSFGDDVDGVSEDEDGTLYLSFRSQVTVPGLTINDEDIAIFNASTNSYALYFDGGDVEIPGSLAIDAFDLQPDGTILLSFDADLQDDLPGIPDDATIRNVVRFIPTSLGPSTQGTFAPYLVGSQNGAPSNVNVDAFFLEK
jgi:hypothetical protein